MVTNEIVDELKGLDNFVQELSKFSDTPTDFSMFTSLIKCSLVKNYEFLKLTFDQDKFENYFFITSFLRSIVEDIIVLESVHHLTAEKREKLLKGIQLMEVKERILKQWDFFQNIAHFNLLLTNDIHLMKQRMTFKVFGRKVVGRILKSNPKNLCRLLLIWLESLHLEFLTFFTNSFIDFHQVQFILALKPCLE